MKLLYQNTRDQVENKIREGKDVVLSVKVNEDKRFDEGFVVTELIPDPLSMGNTLKIRHTDEKDLKHLGAKIEG
jgi:hypothetical protein